MNEILESVSNQALPTVRAIIGTDLQHTAGITELVLEDLEILIFETDDCMDFGSVIMEFLEDGISNGATNAAANHADFFAAFGLSRFAKRTNKTGKIIAFL